MLSFIQMVARVVLTIFPATFLKRKARAHTYLILAPLVNTFVSPDCQRIHTLLTSGTASDPCADP